MADPKTATLPKDSSKETGVSGTLIYGGIITQEEYNRNLTGRLGNQKYEIMRRSDSTIRSTLQVCKLPILSTTWDIQPVQQEDGTITPEDKEKAAFIKRELMQRNVNWFKFIKQALTCFDFGFSLFEKVYEATEFEGKFRIGIKKLASRKQVSIYKWETADGQPGITQISGTVNVSIPREKLVLFTHDQEGENFEGTSLLRYVYKDWDIKDKLTIVNAIALERLGVGVPVVSAKEGQTPDPGDEDDAIDTLKNMRANQSAYLKVPNTMTVEMLDLKGNSTKDVIPTLRYHDGRIMTSILARFMELGGDSGSGAQSLSKDLSSLFMKSEEAVAVEMVATVTDDIIKQLCDLNYVDNSSGYPKLSFGTIADDDNIALATALSGLMTAGAITPDAEIEDDLRGRFRLPLMSKEKKASYEEDHKTPESTPIADDVEIDKLKKDKDIEAAINRSRENRNQLIGALAGA